MVSGDRIGPRRRRRLPGLRSRLVRAAGLGPALALAAFLPAQACARSWSEAAALSTPAQGIYISVGDSYAAGDQPTPGGGVATTRNGFAYQIQDRVAAAGGRLRLVNFGCSGATSQDLLARIGCGPGGLGPGATPYPSVPQAQAVVNSLREHQDQVRLVTVVIGGNDLNGCLRPSEGAPSAAVLGCVDHAVSLLRTNLRDLLERIRGVVGPDVPIVGITYPDIFLGAYVYKDQASREFARASVALFRDRLNPALRAEYTAANAYFVDVTALTGAYGPFETTTELPPYGTLPAPVARVCTLTYYCKYRDLHPTNEGYAAIADQIMRAVKLT